MFDCIVIGGGIIGANILHHLVSAVPKWKIALIERSLVGSGASFYSAGLSFPYGRTLLTKEMASISEKQYITLNKQFHLPINPLSFIGIVSQEKLDQEYKNFLPESVGQINLDSENTLLHINGCHYADVSALTSKLIEHSRRYSSVRIWEGTEIKNIDDDGKIIHLSLQDDSIIYARHVILAPGPWISSEPFHSLTASFGIRNKKVVAFHIDKLPQLSDPILFFLDHDAFLLPLQKRGHWLFSYTCQEWDVSPDRNSLIITSENKNEAMEILDKYCPSLVKHCKSGRVFCDAYTPNRVPIIAPLPTMKKVILAGAANGSGYRLAPAIAQKAVQIMLGTEQ